MREFPGVSMPQRAFDCRPEAPGYLLLCPVLEVRRGDDAFGQRTHPPRVSGGKQHHRRLRKGGPVVVGMPGLVVEGRQHLALLREAAVDALLEGCVADGRVPLHPKLYPAAREGKAVAAESLQCPWP